MDQQVLDGTTGRVIEGEVDGQRAVIDTRNDGERLIELTDEQLVHELTLKTIDLRAAKSEAGRARKKVKTIQDARDGFIDELARRDAAKYNLAFDFGDADEEEEPEEED